MQLGIICGTEGDHLEAGIRFAGLNVEFRWLNSENGRIGITLANHEGHRQFSEPIKTRNSY